MKLRYFAIACLVVGFATTSYARPPQPRAQARSSSGVKAGILTCDVEGGWGRIFSSNKKMRCVFRNRKGQQEVYAGIIERYGLDIGRSYDTTLVWGVIAPARYNGRGSLSGKYIGGGAQASVFAGLGANVLVGGGRDSFALQPVGVQRQAGLNAAVGITEIRLIPHVNRR